MNDAVRKRELKQFKALIWLGAAIYPIWLVYGILSGNYDAPIIVGFITVWAAWYIKYVKLKIEKSIKNDANDIDWYNLPVQRYINYPVLVLSLIAVMFLCVSLLIVLNVFK